MLSHECNAQDGHAYRYALLMVGVDHKRTLVVWSIGLVSILCCFLIVLAAMYLKVWWYGFGTVPLVAIVYFTTRWARRAPDSVVNALADYAAAYAGVPIRQRVVVTKGGVTLNVSEAELAEHNDGRGILNAFMTGLGKRLPSNDEVAQTPVDPPLSEKRMPEATDQKVRSSRKKG